LQVRIFRDSASVKNDSPAFQKRHMSGAERWEIHGFINAKVKVLVHSYNPYSHSPLHCTRSLSLARLRERSLIDRGATAFIQKRDIVRENIF